MSKQIEEVMAIADEFALKTDAYQNDEVSREDLFAARRAVKDKLRELLPVWLPIETAPKDGKCIILGREGDGDREAISVPGFWIEGMGDMPDEMGHDAGFTDVNFQTFCPGRSWGVERYRYPAFQPTRWMPLPAPPSQEGAT
ncbi:hypothetical protein [Comamonas testosteroni]|uniref:hypothetical protein n=1 Tax=Comamonas testosteroni TaxID=285 RepID=UPI0006B96519|nr:hypothetical protein [Comamonas testosteroni]